MSVGQGRGKQKECVFVYISKSVSSCLWREDGGKNSLAPVPSQDRKTAAEREEGREGNIETEGEGEGLSVSTLKVFHKQFKTHTFSQMQWLSTFPSTVFQTCPTNNIYPTLKKLISSLLCRTEQRILGECLNKQKPLERLSFVVINIFKLLVVLARVPWMNYFSFWSLELFCSLWMFTVTTGRFCMTAQTD